MKVKLGRIKLNMYKLITLSHYINNIMDHQFIHFFNYLEFIYKEIVKNNFAITDNNLYQSILLFNVIDMILKL